MKKLEDILYKVRIIAIHGNRDVNVRSITIDSRSIINSPPPGEPKGPDYFMNEDGFVVFTAKYLLERGYCCGNGCKNCPYDYKAVSEPRRSKLLEQRKKDGTNHSSTSSE